MRRAFLCLGLLLVVGIVAQFSRIAKSSDEKKPREDLTKWSDEKLRQAIESAKPGREEERQISEAVRRGGDGWKKFLADRNKAHTELRLHPDKSDKLINWPGCNLNPLTALRRVEGKPDPLQVLVAGKHKVRYSIHHPIEFSALVVNLDAEKQTIHGLTEGGSYRSGRLERWRFEIRDEQAKLLPCIQQFGLMGGGIFTSQDLEYGESWQARLSLRDYVLINKPGTYKLRLHYHNFREIARLETIDGLITAQSDEIELVVEPIRVRATAKERAKAREWIAKLPEEGRVIVLEGIVESSKRLDPISPAGRLQRMYTDAVPDLIDAALDPDLAPGKRAWVLGLLAAITGHNNPCDEFFGGVDVLGSYEYESRDGANHTGTGTIDPNVQREFAEKWRSWKTDECYLLEFADEK